jgi:peptidoglycan/xylan/chitin deacetylase (PgdA/CDA1 family)
VQSPVLLYHKIDRPTPDVKIRGAYTLPRRFESQMSYLKRHGFSFYTASDIADFFTAHGHFPEKGVCVTFDDGWKDNYTHAFPILKKLDIPATIFLVPSCLGRLSDVVTADGEAAREHISADDVREMSVAGVEFGSHSMNHKLFDRTGQDEIESEIRDSKTFIEDLLQAECRVFAYPAGFHTDYARRAVKRAGYSAAFSTVYGSDDEPDLFAINRSEILRRHGYPFRFPKVVRTIFPTNNG